jgi:hypothetical protein
MIQTDVSGEFPEAALAQVNSRDPSAQPYDFCRSASVRVTVATRAHGGGVRLYSCSRDVSPVPARKPSASPQAAIITGILGAPYFMFWAALRDRRAALIVAHDCRFQSVAEAAL